MLVGNILHPLVLVRKLYRDVISRKIEVKESETRGN